MDLVWVSFGFLLDLSWILCWIHVGSRMDLYWIYLGSSCDVYWISIGSLLDPTLIVYAFLLPFVTIWSISSILLGVFEGTINYVCIFTAMRKGGAKARQPAWIQVGHHMDLNFNSTRTLQCTIVREKPVVAAL